MADAVGISRNINISSITTMPRQGNKAQWRENGEDGILHFQHGKVHVLFSSWPARPAEQIKTAAPLHFLQLWPLLLLHPPATPSLTRAV